MADPSSINEAIIQIKKLLWGNSVKEEVFNRWAQGFIFSEDEPTALVQLEGGPCAVIAPVQAFIIKDLLLQGAPNTWRDITSDKQDALLVKAALEIISQAADDPPYYSLVHIVHNRNDDDQDDDDNDGDNDGDGDGDRDRDRDGDGDGDDIEAHDKDSEYFHSRLRIVETRSLDDVEKWLTSRIDMFKEQFGVLLLLYTVVCTKGLEGMVNEMSDPSDPAIDSTYGYGSQSLINLMLTGRAVGHVWDHDQNVGGLELRGIDKQNAVGFLAFLEHLRFCEVGTFLKSPSHPVWVLGSETHLTVLFSTDRRLVSPETPAEQARRIFKKFDPEGNNFIPTNLLQDVLAELGLVADTEYVDIMRKKLDSESLGIILLASFMDEFFPEEPQTCPDTFPLLHYNGLPRSNPDNRIIYHTGDAVLLECTVNCILDSNPMLTVLQTKWPSIEVQWNGNITPSLN
ncbi:ubiquitin carboxyl-terminal hydrolase MINDY-3 homolog [Microplitis demolitor]|uniref:ubiquitin carboxyl-terminal hydrolase MINDY-3 homolog n=1 Tax=Microplitis demolitor TaxID=69319 RepID=UPI0004CCECDE|nr:ubiquitin carboxyl-terminal hydrolase MINDY-3 homolog [Microplitis demolitor]